MELLLKIRNRSSKQPNGGWYYHPVLEAGSQCGYLRCNLHGGYRFC